MLLIAGMHRSGTSLTAKICNILGVELGNNLLTSSTEDNIIGYQEAQEAVNINETLFATLGMRSDDIEILPRGWESEEQVVEISSHLKNWIRNGFEPDMFWGVKDPRICRFLPLWISAAEHCGYNPHILMPFRHPLEVSASLSKRGAPWADVEHNLVWWLLHVLEAERHSRGHERAFVYYPDLLDDWRNTVETIGPLLDIKWPWCPEDVTTEVEKVIDPTQYRNHVLDDAVLPASEVGFWCEQVIKTLLAARSKPSKLDKDSLDKIYTDVRAWLSACQEGKRLSRMQAYDLGENTTSLLSADE